MESGGEVYFDIGRCDIIIIIGFPCPLLHWVGGQDSSPIKAGPLPCTASPSVVVLLTFL